MTTIRNKDTGQYLDDRLSQALLDAIADMEAAAQKAGKPAKEHSIADEAADSAVNRLFRIMSDNKLEYVELPDGRIVTTYRFAQRHSFLGINVYSQESVVDAYIAHDEKKPVQETYS